MKKTIYFLSMMCFGFLGFSQTPIDTMQKNNVAYLEKQEVNGYEFRSQIITEFDQAHAAQNVNIKLDANSTYELVAMGDSDVSSLKVLVNTSKNDELLESDGLKENQRAVAYRFKPGKSGRYKITIQVNEFSDKGKGFVSFMVLKK